MLDSGSPWDESLAFYSGYSEDDLKETDCIKNMAIMLYKAQTSKFQVIASHYLVSVLRGLCQWELEARVLILALKSVVILAPNRRKTGLFQIKIDQSILAR